MNNNINKQQGLLFFFCAGKAVFNARTHTHLLFVPVKEREREREEVDVVCGIKI